MFDLMQYALIFYDFQLILARMGERARGGRFEKAGEVSHLRAPDGHRATHALQ